MHFEIRALALPIIAFASALLLPSTVIAQATVIAQEAGSCADQQAKIKTLYVFQHNDGGLGQTSGRPAVFSSAVLDLERDGETSARGVLSIAHGRQLLLLSASSEGTRFTCVGDGQLIEVAVAFEQRRGDLEALLVITLQDNDSERLWRQARFELQADGMDPIEADGAILVVSALDSVGP